ncbi:Uncharacterised protein [Streptococcus pyogenes]|nr:Uncharacterised protein [Streptococcus pyogenes]
MCPEFGGVAEPFALAVDEVRGELVVPAAFEVVRAGFECEDFVVGERGESGIEAAGRADLDAVPEAEIVDPVGAAAGWDICVGGRLVPPCVFPAVRVRACDGDTGSGEDRASACGACDLGEEVSLSGRGRVVRDDLRPVLGADVEERCGVGFVRAGEAPGLDQSARRHGSTIPV